MVEAIPCLEYRAGRAGLTRIDKKNGRARQSCVYGRQLSASARAKAALGQ